MNIGVVVENFQQEDNTKVGILIAMVLDFSFIDYIQGMPRRPKYH